LPELINRIRFYSYIAALLEGQQRDPLCGICKAFSNTADRMKTDFYELDRHHETEIGALPEQLRQMVADTRVRLRKLVIPENAIGQKKAGNCRMPEGVCFIKFSKSLFEKISSSREAGDMQ
jgi:hypothetical protein